MRYLFSISLALIVHVLLSIVGLMILACTATPAATPTPSGPMYSEAEAIAMVRANLQAKTHARLGSYTCLMVIDSGTVEWTAKYDETGHRWKVAATTLPLAKSPQMHIWRVYERSGTIEASDGNPFGQLC